MSNYPPGVTGAEFEIAGPDWEREENKSCGAEDVSINAVTIDNETISVVVSECPWDGDVLVQGYRHSQWWTCPLCSTQHDEDVEGWDE